MTDPRFHEMPYAEIGARFAALEANRDAWADALQAFAVEHGIARAALVEFLTARGLLHPTHATR